MSSFNHAEWDKHVGNTENLEALTIPQCEEHLRYFKGVSGCLEVVTGTIPPHGKKYICEKRIAALEKAIDQKRSEERSDRRHRQNVRLAWIGIAVAIALVVVPWMIQKLSQPSSTQTGARPTPMPTATPQQSPTATATASATVIPEQISD